MDNVRFSKRKCTDINMNPSNYYIYNNTYLYFCRYTVKCINHFIDKMVLFYTNNINNQKAIFADEEVRHMNNALRKSTGEEIHFIDGRGGLYKGIIEDISRKKAIVQIIEKQVQEVQTPYLEIAIAPTKNIDRIEWFVEKSIELGVQKISFIQCKHSERKQIKMERIERIAIAACKQSKKAHFPSIIDIQPFAQWIQQEKGSDHSFIACLTDNTKALKDIYRKGQNLRICIGPEGGFRDSEIALAEEHNFAPISLGDQRLRTETAGLFSVASIRVLNQ